MADNKEYEGKKYKGIEQAEEQNAWAINVDELYPVKNFSSQLKDELIKVMEQNADDMADRILRNFSASFANLSQDDIDEIVLLYELYTYCLNFADLPLMCIDEEEVYALKMRSLQIRTVLSRAKGGKMMELFMKHHQVITQNIGQDVLNEPSKPTWYKRLFGFKSR